MDAPVVDAFPLVDSITCDNNPAECPQGQYCCLTSLEGGNACFPTTGRDNCVESLGNLPPTVCDFRTGGGCPADQPVCCIHGPGPTYCVDRLLLGYTCTLPDAALADAQPFDASPVDAP